MAHGVPDLFTITGPGSPSVLSDVVHSMEQHADWLAGCIAHTRSRGITAREPEQAAENRRVDRVREVAHTTLCPTAAPCHIGADIPGRRRVCLPYVGGTNTCRRIRGEVAAKGYAGFAFERIGS